MEYRNRNSGRKGHRTGIGGAIATLALAGFVAAAPSVHAQQQPAQPAQAPATQKKPAAQAVKPQNSWVKLCDERPAVKQGVAIKAKVCTTHHERLSAATGQILVSVAIHKVAGQPRETMMVLVPLGLALPPGLQVLIDDDKPIPLKFTFCHLAGCQAEVPATKEIVDKFKKGKELRVRALDQHNRPVGFAVPLTGFTKAHQGEPIDKKTYEKARRNLLLLIRKRHEELAKKAKEARDKKEKEKKKAAPAKPK